MSPFVARRIAPGTLINILATNSPGVPAEAVPISYLGRTAMVVRSRNDASASSRDLAIIDVGNDPVHTASIIVTVHRYNQSLTQ